LPAFFGVDDFEGERVIDDTEQVGHLADQFVLNALEVEVAGCPVEDGKNVLEQCGEINIHLSGCGAGLPDSGARSPQAGELLDLVAPQTSIENVRDRRQQILDGLLHATDVGLRHRIAIGFEASGKLRL